MNEPSRLLLAAANGQITELIEFLDAGDDFNEISAGISPLWIAAQEGHYKICEELLKRHAEVDACVPQQSPLWTAAFNGHANIVLLLYTYGASIERVASKVSPLYIAIQENHIDAVQVLVNCGADVNFRQIEEGYSCLFKACLEGHADLVKYLIHHGADVNLTTFKGEPPLFGACMGGNLQITQVLLEAGAPPNSIDAQGRTALFYARKNKHHEVEKLLLAYGATGTIGDLLLGKFIHYIDLLAKLDPNKHKQITARHFYSQLNNGLCAGYAWLCLMLHDINKVEQFHHDLKVLSQWDGRLETLENDKYLTELYFQVMNLLVNLHRQTKIDSNQLVKIPDLYGIPEQSNASYQSQHSTGFLLKRDELTSCIIKAFEVSPKFVLSNLRHALSIQKVGNQFIIYNFASPTGPIRVNDVPTLCHDIELMLGKVGSDVIGLVFQFINTTEGTNPIVEPFNNFLDELLQDRVNTHNINLTDANGYTALHYTALASNGYELSSNLLKHGISNDYADHIVPPIYLAAQRGDTNLVLDLLHRGANVNTIQLGDSLLGVCAANGHSKTAELLIKYGADFNHKNKENTTPLHFACEIGNTELVEILLACNDINLNQGAGPNNYPPIVIAVCYGHAAIVKRLLEKGADIEPAVCPYGILAFAIMNNQLEVLKVLHENGVSLTKINNLKSSPLQIANSLGFQSIAQYIQTQVSQENLTINSFFKEPTNDANSALDKERQKNMVIK